MKKLFLVTLLVIVFSAAKTQPFGGFMSFDGIDDELEVSGYPIPATSDFTIEFWYRACEDSTYLNQIIWGNDDRMNVDFFDMPSNGTHVFEFCAQYGSVNQVCDQSWYYNPDDFWHHVAITYNVALDDFEYYYDGHDALMGLGGYNYNFFPNPTLTVGFSTYQTWLYTHYRGDLDEFRISDTIRYNGSFTPPSNQFTPDAHTLCLWHFEETNPVTSVLDASGNGFDLIPSGNPRVIHLDNMINQTGNILTVNDTFVTYQWINCSTELPIPGETNQSYVATANGSYAVQVSNTDCGIISDCIAVTVDGMIDPEIPFQLTVSPNPADNQITINNIAEGTSMLVVMDVLGQTIFSASCTTKNAVINTSNFTPGVYFINLVKMNGEKQTVKFIRQ